MKKILGLLLWLLTIFGSFFSISLAQGVDDPTGEWVKMRWSCLSGVWKDCFQYENILWIKDYQKQNYSAFAIAQDIIFAAMYMVWTVLTIVIIRCGLWYIIAARWWKDVNAYKKWLTNGAIWALLVRWAVAIVRLIQYIAQW